MQPESIRAIGLLDVGGAVVVGIVFILIMSLVREPARRHFNAIFVAGAGAAYFSGGFGPWEMVFTSVITALAFKGLESYRWIGVAWLLHTVWDIAHHLWGEPIIYFDPTSSAGCAVADVIIGLWFLADAPSVYGRWMPALARNHDRLDAT